MGTYRTVGEFEKQESVLIIWPTKPFATSNLNNDIVSCNVVKELIGEVSVIICCYNDNVKNRAIDVLHNQGIDSSLISFVIYPASIVYPRDFGAEVMIDDCGNRRRVDFRFDMYGFYEENDELSKTLRNFSEFHSKYVGINNIIHSNLISEGGDREFNGLGVMMAVKETEVNKRNTNKTANEVEQELKRVFNLNKIIWIPQCSYDDEYTFYGAIPSSDGTFNSYRCATANGHIDEFCRFVDTDTILIAHITENEASKSKLHQLNKKRLDLAYDVIKNATNNDGKQFRIFKMPVPEPIYTDIYPQDDIYSYWIDAKESMNAIMLDGTPFPQGKINVLPAQSYCNFLIANNVVIAHKYYEKGMPLIIKEKDEQALIILKTVFPNRRIVQINPLALNMYGGGIHCHTRNIPLANQD